MHNYDVQISKTAASGTWSFNTAKLVSGYLKQIIVKAATTTTTFMVSITDPFGNVIYNTNREATGTLKEELEIPIQGICTVTVSNSSADEAYTGKLAIIEHG